MIIKELLTERVHDVVYHYTSMRNAAKILETWQFKLSSTVGSSYENTLQPQGYPFSSVLLAAGQAGIMREKPTTE